MRVHISGLRNGVLWPGVGEVIDLPDAEAQDMVKNRYADFVTDAVVPEVETAAAPVAAVETRPAPARKPRTRKPTADDAIANALDEARAVVDAALSD